MSDLAAWLIEVGSYKGGGGASIFPTATWIAVYLFAIPLKGSATCRWIQVSTIFSLENVFATQVLNWSSHARVTKIEICGGTRPFSRRAADTDIASVSCGP
jgi:hypothetical protein